jgi:hypothetical protein
MWITRFAWLGLGFCLHAGPAAAENPPPDASAKSKEMLVRAQSEANRRNAGGLLDQIEAQQRRLDPQDSAKVMAPPPDGATYAAPVPSQPEAEGGRAR